MKLGDVVAVDNDGVKFGVVVETNSRMELGEERQTFGVEVYDGAVDKFRVIQVEEADVLAGDWTYSTYLSDFVRDKGNLDRCKERAAELLKKPTVEKPAVEAKG